MSWLKKIFTKSPAPPAAAPSAAAARPATPASARVAPADHAVHRMLESEPPITLDPRRVRCGFCVMSIRAAEVVPKDFVHTTFDGFQGQFWKAVRRVKPGVEVYHFASSSPEVIDIKPALAELGAFAGHSIVTWGAKVSVDGGRTNAPIYVGFAFPDAEPRIIILSRRDAVLPLA